MHEFNVKLSTHKRLIPAHIKGRPPSYYIIAGFVFTSVSVPYLRSEVISYLEAFHQPFCLCVWLCSNFDRVNVAIVFPCNICVHAAMQACTLFLAMFYLRI